MVLQGKKIAFETRDVATSEVCNFHWFVLVHELSPVGKKNKKKNTRVDLQADKNFMKTKSGQTTPPQIFNGENYCGVCVIPIFVLAEFLTDRCLQDYEAFQNAVEDGELESFLQL